MCALRLVDCAKRLPQPSYGHAYGLSPVWMRSCVRRLKSSENRLPHPSNLHCASAQAFHSHVDGTAWQCSTTRTAVQSNEICVQTAMCVRQHSDAHLERLLARVHKLVALELGAVDEALASGGAAEARTRGRHAKSGGLM